MREGVRSGRRANFFITENRFIDCYAKKVGGSGVAVYSILQRCANSETKETWISASKMAEVLDIDKSTVYRKLKELEDLRLIKSMRTREKTIYVVLQVPPPLPAAGSIPLFDAIDFKTADQDSLWPPVAEARISITSANDSYECESSVAPAPQRIASVQPVSRTGEKRNKDEQDLLNKTQEQDFRGNKTLEPSPSKTTATPLQQCASRIVQLLGMAETETNLKTVKAGLMAEIRYTGRSLEEASQVIAAAATNDRENGMSIDKFYFEDTKWRSRNGGRNKAEQQFERIKRARDQAHAIIDAEMDR